jgi:hypothetical protein
LYRIVLDSLVLGPILFVFIILLSLYFLNFLLDEVDTCDKENEMVAKTTRIKALGDAGYQLGGTKGRYLFETFQMINLIFFLRLGMETIDISLNYIVNRNCTSLWSTISCIVLYMLVQCMQDWNHMSWIGYVAAFITATKAFIFLPYAYVEYQDEVISSKEY